MVMGRGHVAHASGSLPSSNPIDQLTVANHLICRADRRNDVGTARAIHTWGSKPHGAAESCPRGRQVYVREVAIHIARQPQMLPACPRGPLERQHALATCPFALHSLSAVPVEVPDCGGMRFRGRLGRCRSDAARAPRGTNGSPLGSLAGGLAVLWTRLLGGWRDPPLVMTEGWMANDDLRWRVRMIAGDCLGLWMELGPTGEPVVIAMRDCMPTAGTEQPAAYAARMHGLLHGSARSGQ